MGQPVGADLLDMIELEMGGLGDFVDAETGDCWNAITADHQRGGEPGEAIDQISLQQGSGEGAAAFDQEAGDARTCQGAHGIGERNAGGAGREFDQREAEIGEGGAAGGVGAIAVQNPDRACVSAEQQTAGERGAQMRIDDDAGEWRGAVAFEPTGEFRVIGEEGADADHDGVVIAAQLMADGAGGGAGDPLARAHAGGDLAIEGGGKFQRDQRARLLDHAGETGIQHAGFGGAEPGFNPDACTLQERHASTIDAGIGVGLGDHDTGDAGIDQGLGAGRGFAVMGAGFQRDIGGGAACGGPGDGEGLGFGVRPAAGRGAGPGDDPAFGGEHAADTGIGRGIAQAPPGESEGHAHKIVIG